MRKLLLQLLCVIAAVAASWAQTAGSGTLSGRITSATGAAVPNAAVTITNQNTNASQKVLTDSDGKFAVTGLAPGNYRLDVESTGMRRTSQQTVVLTAGNPATINLSLAAGNTNETVEIKGVAPGADSSSAEVGMGLGMRPVQELPLIDRNHQDLAGLQSGTTPPTPALSMALDPDRNRFYSTDGQAPFLNQYYTEGLTNQEPVRGTAIRVIPAEAIQQMNVTTAAPTKDKGFTGGAFVMDNVRAGTNGIHGSLYEFWSGNMLRSRNYFDPIDRNAPRFVYNQFGATAGGAIQPDKTFVFGSWEGNYQRGDQNMLSTVPTAAARTGNFAGIPGFLLYSPTTGSSTGLGRIPISGGALAGNTINRYASAIASYIPSPNLPGYANNYISNAPFQNDHQKADARLDHKFGEHTDLFLRYGYTNDHELNGSPLGSVIGAGLRDRLVAQNAAIGFTQTFGPRLVSELRFGYNRYDQKLTSSATETTLGSSLGAATFRNNLASINIPGSPGIGAPAYVPEHPIDNTLNGQWTWNLVTSSNHFQWGVDVRRLRADGFLDATYNQFGPNGAFFYGPGATLSNNGTALSQYSEFYNSYAAFLLGAPSQFGTSSFFVNPTYRQTQYGAWVGDTLQFLNHITVDLGVRYEVYSPLEPAHSGGASFFNTANNTFTFAGVGNTGMHLYDYDLNNIAPRVGVALRADQKTVFRAGYSMQYFQMPYMFSGMMAPMYGSVTGVQGTYSTATIPGGFTGTLTSPAAPPTLTNGANGGNLPVTLFSSNVNTPYVQTLNAQVERDFLAGTVLAVGYVGAFGRHLQGISELNAAAAGAGVAGLPYAAIGRTGSTLFYDNGLTSNYNSAQVSLSRRFAQGFSVMASYTLSKALGYTSASGMLLDPANLRANYGPADWDRQHVLTIGHMWELPFGRHGQNLAATLLGGWQLNGIFTWATGTPLTLTADPLLCACPGNTVLASATGNVTTTTNYGNGQSLILGKFVAPTGSTMGNLGRGAIRGPGFKNYDMSLFKNFHVTDRFNLQLRGEAYNITNSPRLMNPVTNINAPDFGQVTSTVNGAFGRQLNVGARILF